MTILQIQLLMFVGAIVVGTLTRLILCVKELSRRVDDLEFETRLINRDLHDMRGDTE